MFTSNSTYYAQVASKEQAWEYNKQLLKERDVRKTELTKTKSALTETTRKLEQATDDVKSVTKEYKDLKRAVKGDFKKVYDLAQAITGKDPKHLWTHSSGRPIPLAESKISKMTFAIDCEVVALKSENGALEEMCKKFNTRHTEQKDEIAALKQDKKKAIDKQFLSTKIAAKTDEDNKSLKKVIEQGQRRVLTLQNDLIKAQKDVTRIKDLLLCSEAENTKLKQELDSRFCRFVDTLSGGGKKRKLGSSSSTLRLQDSEGD